MYSDDHTNTNNNTSNYNDDDHDTSTNRQNNNNNRNNEINNNNNNINNTNNQHKFDPGELRETVLIRAAARFGRLFLRDPTTLVNRTLLRKLVTTIRTTASLGHRSSVVLWGPPQGGKRSTLEALSQIFCVSVENKAAAGLNSLNNSSNSNNNHNSVGGGVGITVHRHPMNSSSTVGAGSLATTTTTNTNSSSLSQRQPQIGGGGRARGRPPSKRSSRGSQNKNNDNNNNNDFDGEATTSTSTTLSKHYLQTNKGIPILGVVLDGTALRSDHDAAQQCLNALYDFWWLAAMVRARETKKWLASGSRTEITILGQGTTAYHQNEASSSSMNHHEQQQKKKQTMTRGRGGGRASGGNASATASVTKTTAAAGKKRATTAATTPGKKTTLSASSLSPTRSGQQQQQQHPSSPSASAGTVLSASNFLIQGAPFWAVHADELLNWLFTEALPETLHKQAPPTSAAAASNNNNNNQSSSTSTTNHHKTSSSSTVAHNLTAFRSAIQQTFRVFTHGGSTVLTALQTTLLELSKGGISPCFLIHDIRLLGQNCDKILYMISGLLHEQEVLSATTQQQQQDHQQNNNNSSSSSFLSSTSASNNNNNTNSNNASTSMMNAGLNLLAGCFSSSRAIPSTATLCGGGLSIIMTSPNPDLRLEKRLSSRMNCDYFFCPQIVPNFLQCLTACFMPIQENLDTNEALFFNTAWAAEDAVGGVGRSAHHNHSSSSNNNNPIASMIVPGNDDNQTNSNENISSKSNNIGGGDSLKRRTSINSFNDMTVARLQQQLARRRVRAHDDPRLAFMEQVKAIEEDIVGLLSHEEVGTIPASELAAITNSNNMSNINNNNNNNPVPFHLVHPLRAIYLDFSEKCEQLARPAHIIRRLLEAWFEMAIESCYLVNPTSGKQVDIFNDPKSFISGDMLERACFGYVVSSSSSTSSSSNLYGQQKSSASVSSSSHPLSFAAATSFFLTAMNTIYFPSASGNGPLAPLETFALQGTSPSMPRECVSLLACLISAINQQRRGTPNAQVRTLQEHFVLFQELRGNNSTLGTAGGGGDASGSMMMGSSSSSSGGAAATNATIDTIASWVKACALLRRWGIVRVWNSTSIASGGGNQHNNNNVSAGGGGNIAASITSTSKIDLEIENIEALQSLVFKCLSVVYDSQLSQSVKALLR